MGLMWQRAWDVIKNNEIRERVKLKLIPPFITSISSDQPAILPEIGGGGIFV